MTTALSHRLAQTARDLLLLNSEKKPVLEEPLQDGGGEKGQLK